MDHVTAVFELPVTVAVNCVCWEGVRAALRGLRLTLTPFAGGVSVTVALPDLEGSATLVAVMLTKSGPLITAGAVYSPFDKVPTEGVMDHVTAVFALPVTVAMNCLLCDCARVALEGLTMAIMPPAGTS